jgi:hypothetical protein
LEDIALGRDPEPDDSLEAWQAADDIDWEKEINPSTVQSGFVELEEAPTWLENAPYPDDWMPGGVVEKKGFTRDLGDPPKFAKYTRQVLGTHIVTLYTLFLLREDSSLPLRSGKGKFTVVKLPLLESGGRKRPQLADGTVKGYLDRVAPNVPKESLAQSPIPFERAKKIYHIANWIAFDFFREVSCAKCKKPMESFKGRTNTTVDKFNFRACCYPNIDMKPLSPRATTKWNKIVPVFYDFETTPNLNTDVHEFYMGVLKVPEQLEGIYGNKERLHRINHPKEFMQVVDQLVRHCREEIEKDELLYLSIQLVSFNGSRYDDTFLAQSWREWVYQTQGGRNVLKSVQYSERQSALTFNTLELDERLEVRWTDLLRFVPPTSLRELARSFKLTEEKGNMPFNVLNDFVQKGPAGVKRSMEDGFFDLDEYYRGDTKEREISYEYYQSVVPQESRSPSKDVDILCWRYCEQDVKVTEKAYLLLQNLYKTYLEDQAMISPEVKSNEVFDPMCLHSLATLAGKILLSSAHGSTVWGYDTDTNEQLQICPAENKEWQIFAPKNQTYDYCRQALVGGWVKNYYQGLVVDSQVLTQVYPETLEHLRELHQHYNSFYMMENSPHDMTDIASMYPVAVTYPMPLGCGVWIEEKAQRDALISKTINEPDPCKIPKFFLRAKWLAPSNPLFCESTLPQRKEKTNALRWTYWDDLTATRVVCSLDLWIACRDHINQISGNGTTTWTCFDSTDMMYFPKSAQIYRPFMEACTKLKMDGTAEKNELKRTVGKIAMNAGIGKLGQQVEARHNVIGSSEAFDFKESGGTNVRLVGATPISINGTAKGQPALDEVEYCFALKNSGKNSWPNHHAAFMYAASRLMRLNWNLATRPEATKNIGLLAASRPDTLYGDTDSKILFTDHSRLMPKEMIGGDVGQFKPELAPSLLTRPYFQVEPEKVSLAPFISAVSGIMTSKKYFVWATDPATGQQRLKFKCNGLTRFNEGRHRCPIHGNSRCSTCKEDCKHGVDYCFECLPCSVAMLTKEKLLQEEGGVMVMGPGYKYSVDSLSSLTVLDFLRVLLTGVSCKTVSFTFDRTLSLPTSKLPSFTIKTTNKARSLNRPTLLKSSSEILLDKPEEKKIQPFVSGCAQIDINSGRLIPSGSYIFK